MAPIGPFSKRHFSAGCFSSVRAIINFSINEYGYSFSNPFAGVYIASDEEKVKRRSLTSGELQLLSLSCRAEDDELRHLFGLLVNTGMRLGEATGLHTSELFLDVDYPCLQVKPNSARRLKTNNSKRIVPLAGISLWAAKRVKEQNSGYCFPRYTTDGKCNALTAHSKQVQRKVARPERFELPTPRFEAWCSIQLSYGRRREA